MALSPINRTNLLALDPNLATGQVADPVLRKAVFDQYADDFDTIIAAFNVLEANGGIGTTNIANLAVTTAKIALLAVTAAQIADATITTGKIATGGVTSANILDGTIVTGDLADSAISTAKLVDLAVTTAKIALLAIGTAQLADGAVTSAKIADGTIVDLDINSAAAIAWSKINKSGSNLTDLATRLITDLTGVLAAAQFPALTGDLTTVTGALATTLAPSGVVAGSYNNVTVDAKGRVIFGQNLIASASQAGDLSATKFAQFDALTPTGLGTYAVPADQPFTIGSIKFVYESATSILSIYET